MAEEEEMLPENGEGKGLKPRSKSMAYKEAGKTGRDLGQNKDLDFVP